jgi:hypothetical protein
MGIEVLVGTELRPHHYAVPCRAICHIFFFFGKKCDIPPPLIPQRHPFRAGERDFYGMFTGFVVGWVKENHPNITI